VGFFDKFKKKNPSNGLDFTNVDSREKALSLVQTGELVPVYLMALRFGGDENVGNVVYAPAITDELKNRCDDMIESLLRDGKVKSYSATPQYKGNSFIPSSILVTATGESNFSETINIW